MSSTTVHLAVLDTMADWEVGHLAAHLGHLGGQGPAGRFTLETVAARPGPVRTMGGLTVLPDRTLAGLDPASSAMLVLPGGETWTDPEVSAPFVAAARAHLAAGVPVAAVCGATWALAAAGLLDDVHHTSNDPGFLASSGYAGGALYVHEPAVVDGDVVTATGIDPVHFAMAVFRRLGAHPAGRIESYGRLYADHDAAGFFELASA
ncbi:DJ-1/PfpI family protein [Arthrobacter sp. NEB 688]|uniref:DJ-1/PfpI family protein n=1 Tax=Arthrobacter sp. NEB 688 TaxID=904039 RepID=UPI001C203AAC|nr:DJ-1/PfpI family protein [Arthrobacter sp. NEB 688]